MDTRNEAVKLNCSHNSSLQKGDSCLGRSLRCRQIRVVKCNLCVFQSFIFRSSLCASCCACASGIRGISRLRAVKPERNESLYGEVSVLLANLHWNVFNQIHRMRHSLGKLAIKPIQISWNIRQRCVSDHWAVQATLRSWTSCCCGSGGRDSCEYHASRASGCCGGGKKMFGDPSCASCWSPQPEGPEQSHFGQACHRSRRSSDRP
jgi:hypothetical protein